MDPREMGKQILNFNKKAFDNSFVVMSSLQDQAGKVFYTFAELSPLFSKELSQLTADWLKAYKQGLTSFKTVTDDNFQKLEEFFAGNVAGMTKPGK